MPRPYRFWKINEETLLRQQGRQYDLSYLCQQLRLSRPQVRQKLHLMGISKLWTPEEDAALLQLVGDAAWIEQYSDLCQQRGWPSRAAGAIQRRAKQLGASCELDPQRYLPLKAAAALSGINYGRFRQLAHSSLPTYGRCPCYVEVDVLLAWCDRHPHLLLKKTPAQVRRDWQHLVSTAPCSLQLTQQT